MGNLKPCILVTGGAGYVGSKLVPALLEKDYSVKVLDLFLYGEDVFDDIKNHPRLELIKGDLRDFSLVTKSLKDVWGVIHLACISNDPSFELNPELGKSINYDAFEPLVDSAQKSGVQRFIYASSSSVYGVKQEEKVHEGLKLEPLTDYSRYKALCEEILLDKKKPGFVPVVIRPATVCGYAPRLRLDVIVNIMTNHAYTNKKIIVLGGKQLRPNIHIDDMVDLYGLTLELPREKIDAEVFNAGYQNYSVEEIAQKVQKIVGEQVEIEYKPTNDPRSYRISSDKMKQQLGFEPQRGVEEGIKSLLDAFQAGKIPHSMDDSRYFNIKMMQSVNLQ